MNEIERNSDPLDGPLDGVSADIMCVITEFSRGKKKGGDSRKIKSQVPAPCRALCSFTDGTIGFSIRSMDYMLSFRVDKVMVLIKAAADSNREYIAPGGSGEGDADEPVL